MCKPLQIEGFARGCRRLRGASESARTGIPNAAEIPRALANESSQSRQRLVSYGSAPNSCPLKPERLRMPSGLYGTFPGGVDCVSHFGLVSSWVDSGAGAGAGNYSEHAPR